METHCYRFDDMFICLESPSDALIGLIADYTCLVPTRRTQSGPRVIVALKEHADPSALGAFVPQHRCADAQTNVYLQGERQFRRYLDGEENIWHTYQDYGAVHMDLKNSRVDSLYCGQIGKDDLLPFIVFFISPLTTSLRRFGYQYIHAAACRVLDANILFTGLSGRGKSTASFALAIKGHSVLTDESVLLRRKDGQVYASALMNWIKVSREVMQRFWPACGKGSAIYNNEVAVKAREFDMAPLTKLEKIDFVCILRQTGREETTIQPADALDVAPDLLPASVNAIDRETLRRSFVFLTDLLKEAECRSVSFGTDMDRFVLEVEQLASRKGELQHETDLCNAGKSDMETSHAARDPQIR